MISSRGALAESLHSENSRTISAATLSVPLQILERAKNQPTTIALRSGNLELSYGALYYRANQFAQSLQQRASLSGGTVAICLERSVDWTVAALAVMCAGAAYVPLDPTWPDARIRYAIKESGAVALVARTATFDRLDLSLPCIDPRSASVAIGKNSGVTECDAFPENLAYVIYTSGSTGTPKGVEITHANLANLVAWHQEDFGLSSQDCASHLAGLGFDAAAWEIWPALCTGATVCIPDDSVLSSPISVYNWMIKEKIAIGFVPSIYAAVLMEMEWPSETALRFLLTGGDVLHRGPKKQLPFAVVNNYGPTECTVVATSAILQTGDASAPPIGKPIAGTTLYLLDENKNEVAPGEPGEIYIGGDKVGRGYRNLPELTKEFFVADKFAATPGGRLYRTGDRGALRLDGQIQFLGRMDRQVKIRGKRLELDEVANVLSLHPSVSLATVVASRESAEESRHLIAYVVSKQGYETSQDELVAHLSQHLPDYMVPSVFVKLQQMPLSSSGKLDYAALPLPAANNLLHSAPKEKPDTATEEQLLEIIQGLLKGKAIGVNDNVFLAGGDSLLGMQLIIALKNKFDVELRFDQIFEAATIRDLSSLIEDIQKDSVSRTSSSGVLSLPKTSSNKAQGNSLFWVLYLNVNLDKALGQDRPVIFLVMTPEDIDALGEKPTLNNIAALFVKKILMTQPEGPYTVGGFCMGAVLAYEIAVQLRKGGHEVSDLVMLDAPGPSYLKIQSPLSARINNPLYVFKRIKELGLRTSLRNINKRIKVKLRIGAPKPETELGQNLIETAATTYQCDAYDGRTLLILAAHNAPHINFLPEWQALIPHGLHYEYIDGHHYDLLNLSNVQRIAAVISTHLDTPQPLPDMSESAIKTCA